MSVPVSQELAALRQLTLRQLQARYVQVFGEQAHSHHKVCLIKRIVWRLQVLAEGDLSARARRRAQVLANDADLRLMSPLPSSPAPQPPAKPSTPAPEDTGRRLTPETVITRLYKGHTLHVKVLSHGFEFDGAIYKSLSAVAKKITGQHCNGYFFFRIGKEASR